MFRHKEIISCLTFRLYRLNFALSSPRQLNFSFKYSQVFRPGISAYCRQRDANAVTSSVASRTPLFNPRIFRFPHFLSLTHTKRNNRPSAGTRFMNKNAASWPRESRSEIDLVLNLNINIPALLGDWNRLEYFFLNAAFISRKKIFI